MKHPISRVIFINLIILVVYTVIVGLVSENERVAQNYVTESAYAMMILVFFHVVANALLAIVFFISKRKQMGFGALISVLIVFIIGFSACWGVSELITPPA